MGDHIRGEPQEIRVGATSAPRVKVGELMSYVSGTLVSGLMRATNAAAWAWDSDLATTQANFKRTFLGCSRDFKASGDFRDISVASEGVYRFPVSALGSGFAVGSTFAPAQDGANNALSATQLAPCASGLAIATLVRPAMTNDTSIEVRIAGELDTPSHGIRSV